MTQIAAITVIKKSALATFQHIYGIGLASAKKYNAFYLTHPSAKKIKNLKSFFLTKNVFRSQFIDYNLKKTIFRNLLNKAEISTYGAVRMFTRLPSRGQRTKTNAKTAKVRPNPISLLGLHPGIIKKYTTDITANLIRHNKRILVLQRYLKTGSQNLEVKLRQSRKSKKKKPAKKKVTKKKK
jgi:small subunit ribosomal protein S13